MADLERTVISELESHGPERGSELVQRLGAQGFLAGETRAVLWRLLDRGSVDLNWNRQLYVPRTL